jgi:hypothetical protein
MANVARPKDAICICLCVQKKTFTDVPVFSGSDEERAVADLLFSAFLSGIPVGYVGQSGVYRGGGCTAASSPSQDFLVPDTGDSPKG